MVIVDNYEYTNVDQIHDNYNDSDVNSENVKECLLAEDEAKRSICHNDETAQ
jgi:hypothetical protein